MGNGDAEAEQEEGEEQGEEGDWGLGDDWIENGKKEKSEGEEEGRYRREQNE